MKIDFAKSCIGQIISNMMVIKPTEFLKYFEYEHTDEKSVFENIYIKKLLLSLVVIDAYTFDDIVNPNLVLLKCRTKLHNLVEKRLEKVVSYEESYNTRLCKITKKDEPTIKQDGIPVWIETIDDEIKIFIEKLDDILLCNFMKYFLKNEKDHLIFPNLLSYRNIFTKNKLEEFIKVMNTDMIYDILSEIEFVYIIKNTNKNRSIFNFTEADIDYLMSIIANITSYVDNIFNGKEYDRNNILIRIHPDKDYNYFSISFIIINKYNISKYKLYIDLNSSINIHELIYNLQTHTEIFYYLIVNKSNSEFKHIYCKKPISKINIKKDIIKLNSMKTTEYCILQQLQHNMESLKIITSSYPLNKYHSYCSISILVLLGTSYYNITIKSITFDEIKDNIEFKDNYLCELAKIQYRQSGNLIVGEGLLPATVEVIIKPILNPQINYTLAVIETGDYYNTVVLPRIKNNVIIDFVLILKLIWFKEYTRILTTNNIKDKLFFFDNNYISLRKRNKDITNFIQLTQYLLLLPTISFSIYSMINMVYTQDFMMSASMNKTYLDLIYYFNYIKYRRLQVNRQEVHSKIIEIIQNNKNINITEQLLQQMLNRLFISGELNISNIDSFIVNFIDSTNESYLIWYMPNIYIDYDILLKYLEDLNLLELYNNDNPINIYTESNYINNLKKTPREVVNRFTNFYELFQNGSILYNMRSINKKTISQLKKLLLLKDKSLIVFFHYPNADIYSILHLHAYPNNKNTEDITGHSFDISFDRSYLFEKYEDIDDTYFHNKPIILSWKIKGNVGLSKKDLKQSSEYCKFKQILSTRVELDFN